MGGLRASMGYMGSVDIDTMRTQPEFVRVSRQRGGVSCARHHDYSRGAQLSVS